VGNCPSQLPLQPDLSLPAPRGIYSTEGGNSAGFSFDRNKREAVRAARDHLRELGEQAEPLHETAILLNVPTTKVALVRWLNLHAAASGLGDSSPTSAVYRDAV
jgi:hypothetical protein